jgi:hypothetical protein
MIGLTFLIFAKDVSAKLFATLILILSLTNLFGSMSRGGFVGLSAALLLLIIIAVRQDLKGRIIIISSITVIIAVFIGVDAIFGGLMSSRLKSMVQLEKQDNSAALIIIPEGDKLLVTSDDDKSYLVCVDNQFEFMDSNTNVIETVEADGKYKLAGDKHESLTFYYVVYENLPGINIKQNNIDINIIKLGDQYKILNPVGQFVDIEKIESWGFDGYEKIGSSRGYIWSRTIPLLKYNILFGQGPDTYALAFPQNDVFGKAIAFNDPWIVVDKPHNMYLQMGVNTGVISMLAFIAMYMIYFIQSIPLYFKGKLDNFLKISGAAFLLATFAYMITGFFNDSVVSVAPVFWILLGSGIGINLKLKEDIKVKDARVAVAGN